VKIEGVYQIKGRGTVLGCSPTTRPHTGSILRHADGRVWLITGVERFCVPWSPGEKSALLIRPAADGQPEPVEGDDVEMVEPLTLAARVAALEAHVATLAAVKAVGDRQEALADRCAARCEALEAALLDAAAFIEPPPNAYLSPSVLFAARDKAAELRALAAGTAAAVGKEPAR